MMLLILFLLSTVDNLELQQDSTGGVTYMWYCDGYVWDAQVGDTLMLYPAIPLGLYDNYILKMGGDARALRLFYRINVNLPIDNWEIAINNTQGNKNIRKEWHPWEQYKLRMAAVALIAGERNLRFYFLRYR